MVSKLQPVGHTWPPACFVIAHEPRIILHFQMVTFKMVREVSRILNFASWAIKCKIFTIGHFVEFAHTQSMGTQLENRAGATCFLSPAPVPPWARHVGSQRTREESSDLSSWDMRQGRENQRSSGGAMCVGGGKERLAHNTPLLCFQTSQRLLSSLTVICLL